jgi:hypothetical protein
MPAGALLKLTITPLLMLLLAARGVSRATTKSHHLGVMRSVTQIGRRPTSGHALARGRVRQRAHEVYEPWELIGRKGQVELHSNSGSRRPARAIVVGLVLVRQV